MKVLVHTAQSLRLTQEWFAVAYPSPRWDELADHPERITVKCELCGLYELAVVNFGDIDICAKCLRGALALLDAVTEQSIMSGAKIE